MALTVAVSRQVHSNGQLCSYGTITWDSSYATGGEAIVPNNFKLGAGDFDLRVFPQSGYTFEHDKTAKKVLAYRVAGLTPAGTVAAPTFTGSALGNHGHSLTVAGGAAAAGTDALSMKANVINKESAGAGTDTAAIVAASGGTPAGTNSAPGFTGTAIAAAALIEVANAVDLSAVIAKYEAVGAF